jgi:hypothetical protein
VAISSPCAHSSFDPVDETALDANRIYLRSSLFSGRIMRGSNANSGANEIVQFAADEPVVRELQANAYYVGNTTTGSHLCPQRGRRAGAAACSGRNPMAHR